MWHFQSQKCLESCFLISLCHSAQTRLFWKLSPLRERSRGIVSFVEHPVYSLFKMHSIFILVFSYFDSLLFIQNACNSRSVLNFWVLRERNRDIALLMEHLLYNISKMYSVLILGFLFWFAVTYPKNMWKIICSAYFSCFFRRAPCV